MGVQAHARACRSLNLTDVAEALLLLHPQSTADLGDLLSRVCAPLCSAFFPRCGFDPCTHSCILANFFPFFRNLFHNFVCALPLLNPPFPSYVLVPLPWLRTPPPSLGGWFDPPYPLPFPFLHFFSLFIYLTLFALSPQAVPCRAFPVRRPPSAKRSLPNNATMRLQSERVTLQNVCSIARWSAELRPSIPLMTVHVLGIHQV